MLPMRLLRARRKSGESRAEVRRKSGGGPGPVSVPHRTALCGDAPPVQGAAGPFSRLRQGLCGSGSVPCPAGSSAVPASAPCPAGSSAAAARVLCCSSLCGTCGRPSAPSVSPVLRPVRATRCGCRLLRSLRPASASRFSHRRPGFPPRFGDPASRLAPAPRYLCSSGRGGRDRPVRIRPPPGPDPPAARAAPHSGRRRGIAALPGLFRFGGRCESSVIIRKCAGDGIVE